MAIFDLFRKLDFRKRSATKKPRKTPKMGVFGVFWGFLGILKMAVFQNGSTLIHRVGGGGLFFAGSWGWGSFCEKIAL